MSGELTVATPSSAGVARRAAVTLGAVALLAAAQRTLLPFVDGEAARGALGVSWLDLLGLGSLRLASWGALGLWPFLPAFVLVEAIAAVVPGLRPLRNGSAADRMKLDRAAWAVALVLAAAHAWDRAIDLSTLRDLFGFPVLASGTGPQLGVAASMVAATAGAGVAAGVVSRHGLGNGFAVLLAVDAFERVGSDAVRAVVGARTPWTEEGALLAIVLLALPIVLALRPRRGGDGPRVPVPTCGLAIVNGPATLAAFPARLGEWLPAAAPLAARLDEALWTEAAWAALALPLTAALAVACSRLFCPEREVVGAYARASPGAPDGAAASVRGALRSAHRGSLALAVGVAALPELAWFAGVPFAIPVSALFAAFVVAAVARDLRAEAVFRAGAGALVSAWPLHRVYAVEPVLAALARAGIPAHARMRRFRALYHFFAPWAPVEILVPRERAAEATGICARVAGP